MANCFSGIDIAVCGLLFARMNSAAPLIVFGVCLTLANNILSFSGHAYQTELYPTRIRARAVGFVYSWSRISVVFSSFVIGFVLEHSGAAGDLHADRGQHGNGNAGHWPAGPAH